MKTVDGSTESENEAKKKATELLVPAEAISRSARAMELHTTTILLYLWKYFLMSRTMWAMLYTRKWLRKKNPFPSKLETGNAEVIEHRRSGSLNCTARRMAARPSQEMGNVLASCYECGRNFNREMVIFVPLSLCLSVVAFAFVAAVCYVCKRLYNCWRT